MSENSNVGDVYPPSKVLDLAVVDIFDNQTRVPSVTINFTAPGDDLDSGTGNFPIKRNLYKSGSNDFHNYLRSFTLRGPLFDRFRGCPRRGV